MRFCSSIWLVDLEIFRRVFQKRKGLGSEARIPTEQIYSGITYLWDLDVVDKGWVRLLH